jgi:signal recognition particle subunit SRP54
VPFFELGDNRDPIAIANDAIKDAKTLLYDTVILDTAGRLHVDEELMQELTTIKNDVRPSEILFVADAMTGQDAVKSAKDFDDRLGVTGIVLTKLDGDARGGAALSVKAVTGRPIKLASVGERLDQLEYFHPDRMASRILGMGDVLSLVEKAEAAVEEDERAELERRMMQGEFSFDDFLKSYKMLRRMGPLQGVMKLIPGLGNQLEGLDQVDEKQLARVEAIILSMTPRERALPHLIDGSRRQRIARGSGSDVQQVNQLLEARKQMAKLMKQMRSGKMPSLPGLAAPGAPNGARAATARKTKSKRKKKKSRR